MSYRKEVIYMNNIIELENTRHENAFLGYQHDILRYLKNELAENVGVYKSEMDEIFESVKQCVHVISSIENYARSCDLIVVFDVFYETMSWKHVEITTLVEKDAEKLK